MPRRSNVRLLPSIVLIAAVLITFAGAMKNQFVNWDDHNEIWQNPHLNPVTWDNLGWNWSHTELSLYMPITYMVWGAVAAVAPRDANHILQPMTFHALNIGLHLCCTLLVFRLLLQLGSRAVPATIGALVFAVHPLQVEPVAWASGMYTLLSTALSLAAIIFYLKHRNAAVRRGPTIYYWLATLLYAIALLTKAASVSVPVAVVVIDVLILRRPGRRAVRSMILWVVLGIPVILYAKWFQDVSSIPTPAIWARPIVALDAFGFYLRKIILPIHLIPDYGRNPTWVLTHHLRVLVSVVTATVAILLAYLSKRNAGWIAAGIGLILAGICPYLGLTTFDFQYVSTVADRYAYFGMLGVALLAARAAARSHSAMLGSIAVVIICITLSRLQVRNWSNDDALFSHTLAVNPDSLVAHSVFGFLAAQRKDFDTAEKDYLSALRIWQQDTKIHFDLANLYLLRSRNDRPGQNKWLGLAIDHYSVAARYQPRLLAYRNGLAVALTEAHRPKEAYDVWTKLLSEDPGDVVARNNLADLLLDTSRLDEARYNYQTVLRYDPMNEHAAQKLRDLEKDSPKK